MFKEGTRFCKTHFYFAGISAISHYLTVVSQQQRWYLWCQKGNLPAKEHRGPGTQRRKLEGEQTAKKLHLLNANCNNGVSLTMDYWDCQIKPHLATLSVWHPLEEDALLKASSRILSSHILSLPHCCPLGGRKLS